jgi:uncharacterized protein YaaN involved in tellurite resistance
MTNEHFDEAQYKLQPPLEALAPPKPVAPVPVEQADGLVKLAPAAVQNLDAKVAEFINTVASAEVHSKPFEDRVLAIHNLGTKEIRASANVSNRMLDRPVKAMESGFFDDGSEISRSLVDLRNTIEELDPSRQGDLLSPQKLLGLIPFGKRVQNYFQKYQSAQGHINAIINSLYRGQDELRKDNAVIEQEKVNLWNLMQRLQQYVYVGKKIDVALEDRVAEIEVQDPEKARMVREEMLFYVRQKVQDLLTQLTVNIQGYLALDMLRKNNLELIKAVDRATTTTVSALRTAVMVAQALTNQRLVLEQINALQTTTSNLIESTSVLLKKQTGDIHQQATSAMVNIEQLQIAFDNIYETMDMIADYKVEALNTMRQTVDTLSAEVDKAQQYLDRVRSEEAARLTREVDLLAPDTEIQL